MAAILTQADMLAKFLREQVVRPFAWGDADCGLMLADWVMVARGISDPAATVRGTYSDPDGANAILAAHGGVVAYVGSLAAAAGLSEAVTPHDGDIGIVDLPTTGLTGAIMSQSAWAFRTARGMVWSKVTPGRLVKAWAVYA